MVFWSMVVEMSAPVRCRAGLSPVTSTLSDAEPTLSFGERVAMPPTLTVMPLATEVSKPSCVNVAVYVPGRKSETRNWPEAFDLMVRATPVSVEVTLMIVPGRSAPLLSVTVPAMAPVVASCAYAFGHDVAEAAAKSSAAERMDLPRAGTNRLRMIEGTNILGISWAGALMRGLAKN